MDYGFKKDVDLTFEEAIEKTTGELKKEGFGVLTEIDVRDTLKNKLDVDFRKYKILGACNPPFAHQALQQETEIGLLLPCNVIVYENDNQKITVAAIDAHAMLSVVKNSAINPIATEINERLKRVINNV